MRRCIVWLPVTLCVGGLYLLDEMYATGDPVCKCAWHLCVRNHLTVGMYFVWKIAMITYRYMINNFNCWDKTYVFITTRGMQSFSRYTQSYIYKKSQNIFWLSLTGNFFRCWTFLVINMKVKVYICIAVYDMLVVIVIVVAMWTIIVTMVDMIPQRW